MGPSVLGSIVAYPKDETAENRAFPYALAWLLGQSAGEIMPWNSDQHLRMEQQLEGTDLYEVTNKERFAMLCYWSRYLGFVTRLRTRRREYRGTGPDRGDRAPFAKCIHRYAANDIGLVL